MELLIVIALISILAVGVLATINPVEQRAKATDANIMNDAGEVLNAYERYYVNKNSYPWMDVNGSLTVATSNLAWFGRSDQNGAGLCSTAATATPQTTCPSYKGYLGLLISSDELKSSFLEKGYTSVLDTEPSYNAAGMNYLWINKLDSASGNSIFVCFIPKASSNKLQTNNLWEPVLTGGVVTGLIQADAAEFLNGKPVAARTFASPATSLFKCVP